MSNTYMTPEQYINYMLNLYPISNCSSNFQSTKLKVFDQTFNVIGNGIENIAGFLKEITITEKNQKYIDAYPPAYTSGTPLFMAYTKLQDLGESTAQFKIPELDSILPNLYTEDEIKNTPTIVYSMAIKNEQEKPFVPYPNFKKEYSLLWDQDINKLSPEWINAGLSFYKECKRFFQSENIHLYSYAAPADNDLKSWESKIKDYDVHLVRYLKNLGAESQEEVYKRIEKDYGIPYNGDTKEFIKKRWEIELANINSFLDETIDMLSQALQPKNTDTPSKPKFK